MRRAHGFTLLETIVALAVLGLIVAVLAVGLRFALGTVARQAARSGAGNEVAPVLDYLVALIADSRPVALTEGAPVLFDGTPGQLVFAAPLTREMTSSGGIQRIQIHRTQAGLELVWVSLSAGGQGGRAVLLPGRAPVRFRYFGGVPGVWRDTWQGMKSPPLVVAISLGGAAEGFVAPRVTGIASPIAR